jgi:hypothetical protein
MTEEEKKITLKIRALVEIEEVVNEISDIIDIAESQDWIRVEINENLHPMVLKRLEQTRNIRWYKKSKNIFWRTTVLIWD